MGESPLAYKPIRRGLHESPVLIAQVRGCAHESKLNASDDSWKFSMTPPLCMEILACACASGLVPHARVLDSLRMSARRGCMGARLESLFIVGSMSKQMYAHVSKNYPFCTGEPVLETVASATFGRV